MVVTMKNERNLDVASMTEGLNSHKRAKRIGIAVQASPVNFDCPASPLKTPAMNDHQMIYLSDPSCVANDSL